MKPWVWVIIASLGLALMFWAYNSRERLDPAAPWASGLIILSPESPAEKSAFPAAIQARLRLLSSNDIAELLLFATGDVASDKALGVKAHVRVKLIELPLAEAGIGAIQLQSGRLPEAGQNEILAGARMGPRETLIVGGHSLKVVGVLKPDLALLATSFLIPPHDATRTLFPAEVPTVLHAWLVSLTATQLGVANVRKSLDEAFPPQRYAWVTTEDRLEPRAFYSYLCGLAILLVGGSGALIGLFRWLAGKVTEPALAVKQSVEDLAPTNVGAVASLYRFLAGPLLEMKARPRLVWGVHLVYYGLVIAGSLLIYELPEVQAVLMGKVREALSTNSNPLGVAGEAYLSGNIPRAALVTFLINFLLGSLACITLPSMLLPGSGVFVAGLRATLWGLILAPATPLLAFAMLPHSLTMLLEGEGYILATLFGLLIPIHIVQGRLGGNPLTRFGRVLLLGLTAQFWIALVLAVAAIYEATEVILMNR
jgi:hypothetical protein